MNNWKPSSISLSNSDLRVTEKAKPTMAMGNPEKRVADILHAHHSGKVTKWKDHVMQWMAQKFKHYQYTHTKYNCCPLIPVRGWVKHGYLKGVVSQSVAASHVEKALKKRSSGKIMNMYLNSSSMSTHHNANLWLWICVPHAHLMPYFMSLMVSFSNISSTIFCFQTLNNSNEDQLIWTAAEGGGFAVADASRCLQ